MTFAKPGLVILTICIGAILYIACNDRKSVARTTITLDARSLSGYWIPKEIKWGGDDPNSKDTGDIFRTADFHTLCFDSAGRFIMFATTQRRPINYNDSIIFAGEPIIKMDKVEWIQNNAEINITYKALADGHPDTDTTEKHETIKINVTPTDTILQFQNKLYIRTTKYDQISRSVIDGYKQAIYKGLSY